MLGGAIAGFLQRGYQYIGMDHFALPDDALAVAKRQGRLHRNFQGYSTQPDCDLIGLGVSAIGKVGASYYQNVKALPEYYDALRQGQLPVQRGIALTRDDLLRRAVIMALMCQGRVEFESIELAHLIDMRAYFARELSLAKSDGRISRVSKDPLMTVRAIWDIGGTGAKADACAIWICQFVDREIRVLDYYEAVGQPLATHVQWLRKRSYENALCILPHDGATNDKVFDVSYESALREAGFEVEVVPNQGKGAATMRIEAARRRFPSVWFNEATTQAGRDALGWYHEKKSDDERNIGLGPEHDWSSHGADAFGLMCVVYEAPKKKQPQDIASYEWVV